VQGLDDAKQALAIDWWVENGPKLAQAGLRIALILLIAIVVRWLLRRLIDRLTRGGNADRKPSLLRPLGNGRHRPWARWCRNAGTSAPRPSARC